METPDKNNLPAGKWQLIDGRMVPIEEPQQAEQPNIEIAEDYQHAIEQKEKAVNMQDKFAIEESSNSKAIAVLMRELEATRTNDSYWKHINDRSKRGQAVQQFPRTQAEIETLRIQKAVELNDSIKEYENRAAATEFAKEYFEYVRKGMQAARMESEVTAKTLETMEAEEQELAALAAKGEATEAQQRRTVLLATAKAVLKRLSTPTRAEQQVALHQSKYGAPEAAPAPVVQEKDPRDVEAQTRISEARALASQWLDHYNDLSVQNEADGAERNPAEAYATILSHIMGFISREGSSKPPAERLEAIKEALTAYKKEKINHMDENAKKLFQDIYNRLEN